MKSNFPFNFILLFILIISILCEINEEDYKLFYYGNIIEVKDHGNSPNDCLCDITSSCDYLCCCDKEDCPPDAIKSWRKYSKCIDEKDTMGIFADRCVDFNLFSFKKQLYENKIRRRGLHLEKQTEDIYGLKGTITNFCFSIDNSGKMKKTLLSFDDLVKRGFKKIDNEISTISDKIINKDAKNKGFNVLKENDEENINNRNINNRNIYHNGPSNNYYFKNSNYFSLYSGSNCQNSKNVEILKSENYSCSKSIKITEKNLESINLIYNATEEKNEVKCSRGNKYFINDDGIFNSKANNNENCDKIVEVEFLLEMKGTELKINSCKFNIVCTKKDYNIFKNSVIFSNTEGIPYRFSGNGGYLNNFPLKVFAEKNGAEKKVFNEFYIVGRKENGNCRDDNDFYNYLYNYDKPLYFNQDYSYSCKLENTQNINETTLYKKLKKIIKIGKYGSSSYKNANGDNNNDWLNVTINPPNKDEKHIIMKIYVGKKKTGLYSHKYIHNVSFTSKKSTTDDTLVFEVKFEDLEKKYESNDAKYKEVPSIPLFTPKIPQDLLDPLFTSEVDK